MTTTVQSVDVAVPVSIAYNQWTQFESFPHFMQGVERVDQITDTKTHWHTSIGGVRREFEAEITEQHPDQRIAWQTVDGVHQAGVVTFHRLDDNTTRVTLQMHYQPEGFAETVGDLFGAIERRIQGDLENFKKFIETRNTATGSWRGEVPREPQRDERTPVDPVRGADPRQQPVDPTLGRVDQPPA
ncbi:MAG TPA: SRPBCC family protein [Pseudonocardiaceae bacterium]|jgi:uncharacterized membrane protein|nr:SRPBCC family protein [Pseudonocardiaceae bacterium]